MFLPVFFLLFLVLFFSSFSCYILKLFCSCAHFFFLSIGIDILFHIHHEHDDYLLSRVKTRLSSLEESMEKLRIEEEQKKKDQEQKQKEAETMREVQALAVKLEAEEKAKRSRRNSRAVKGKCIFFSF